MKYSYTKVRNTLGEVQQSLHWYLVFTKSPNVVKFTETEEIRISAVTLPAPEITHTEVQLGGYTMRFAGKVNKAGTVDITLVEGTDTSVLTKIHKWFNAYWSNDFKAPETTALQNYAEDLYADVEIYVLDGMDRITQTFKLIDCLPSFAYGLDLGQDAAAQNVTLTLSFNDYHWQGTGGTTPGTKKTAKK